MRRYLTLTLLLLLVGITAVIGRPSPSNSHRSDGVADTPRTDAELTVERLVHALHNDARENPADYGYPQGPAAKLTGWTDLLHTARDWSDTLVNLGDLQHNPDAFSDPHTCCWRRAAENVAYITVPNLTDEQLEARTRRIFQQWMDSEGHRVNILEARFDEFAVGVRIDGPHRWPSCTGDPRCDYYRMHLTANFRQRNTSATPPGSPYTNVPANLPAKTTPDSGGTTLKTGHPVQSAAQLAAELPAGSTLLLATSQTFPDALASAPLVAAHDAALLFTRPDRLSDEVAAAIEQVRPGHVILLGGVNALSTRIADELAALAVPAISRISGPDRFATAAKIAQQLNNVDEVLLVEGVNADPMRGWPDAVNASWYAARTGAAILLTGAQYLPEATRDALKSLSPEKITIVGGTAAVSDQVRNQAQQATPGAHIERIAGPDRYATALEMVRQHPHLTSEISSSPSLVDPASFHWALISGTAAHRNVSFTLPLPADLNAAEPTLQWLDQRHARHPEQRAELLGSDDAFPWTLIDAVDVALSGHHRWREAVRRTSPEAP